MKMISMTKVGLAVLSATILSANAGYAVSIYVNDNWGAAPARSSATIPFEDQVETRVWLNPQTGNFHTTEAAALAETAPEEVADGPDAVFTGLQNIEYFPLAATYNVDPTGNTVTDPTTGSASDSLTLGTNAFASVTEAIAAIGSGAAPAGTDKIVVLAGTYFETIVVPRNNNDATGEITTTYYNPLTLADFNGKMATNFTIAGDPIDKPTFTRGLYLDGEATVGMTISNIRFAGIPGSPVGSGVHVRGAAPSANTSGASTGHIVVQYSRATTAANGINVFPDPGPAGRVGYRKDFTFKNNVIDGMGVRIPFFRKAALNAAAMPGYTTQPAYTNQLGFYGGRGGMILDGEYGTLSIIGNTFKGIRNFTTFDTNAAGIGQGTWTTIDFKNNTIDDCWGNLALRGTRQAGGSSLDPAPGNSDVANVVGNTVRNMGEGALEVMSLSGPNDFIQFHEPSSGAAFKLFDIRNPRFINNSIVRVSIMQDWFTKAVKVLPGDPDFLPMGAGVLVRDLRNSTTNPDGPWADYTTAEIHGNLFDSCQQGVAVDPPGTKRFIPGGSATGNTFINCRSGFFFYDGIINSLAMTISGNVFTESNEDPTGIGIGAGANQTDVQGGIVFDENSNENAEGSVMDLADNFYDGGPAGPNGVQNNSPVVDAGDFDASTTVTAYPNLDTDGDGISDTAETEIGTNPASADTDGDGVPDGVEVRIGSDPTDINDPTVGGSATDTDNDNVPDSVEIVLGLDPNEADSDLDRIRDDYELLVGTDALDINSVPDLGEANGTPGVNNADAIRILEAFLNLATLDKTNIDRADINRDGLVDNVDAVILFQWTLTNIPYIPFP